MNKKVDLVNAKVLAQKHPNTFQRPTETEIAKIQLGDFVKVCAEPERFWVKVYKIDWLGRTMIATVSNDLLYTHHHGLLQDDDIELSFDNIYNIYKNGNNN